MCFDVKPHIEDPTPTDLTLPAIAGPFSMVGMSLPPLATFFPYHETNPDPEPAIDTALIFQEDGDRNYLGAAADKEPEHDVLLDESLLGSLFTSINVPAPRNHVCKVGSITTDCRYCADCRVLLDPDLRKGFRTSPLEQTL